MKNLRKERIRMVLWVLMLSGERRGESGSGRGVEIGGLTTEVRVAGLMVSSGSVGLVLLDRGVDDGLLGVWSRAGACNSRLHHGGVVLNRSSFGELLLSGDSVVLLDWSRSLGNGLRLVDGLTRSKGLLACFLGDEGWVRGLVILVQSHCEGVSVCLYSEPKLKENGNTRKKAEEILAFCQKESKPGEEENGQGENDIWKKRKRRWRRRKRPDPTLSAKKRKKNR